MGQDWVFRGVLALRALLAEVLDLCVHHWPHKVVPDILHGALDGQVATQGVGVGQVHYHVHL